jgi:hypothetical protein
MYPHRIQPIDDGLGSGYAHRIWAARAAAAGISPAYLMRLALLWRRTAPLSSVIPLGYSQALSNFIARLAHPATTDSPVRSMPRACYCPPTTSEADPPLQLEWPGDRAPEVERTYAVDWTEPVPIIVPGSLFDLLI